ncbi:M3 family oligoendopeptidase [Pseudalkalibacillus caeni]|uniref:M3 family oligoendopeptidase n=1 Tax=Exobacillus caeni TaxID=2574798 RepID=A0A5R9EYX1_9BACL|nr:M3 family oligoendopeptidase [Pseudalkalibacillus caeni]TLS36492.1 M3 family oligoendopeptidase [Pseudalkalibacillus caeni]
MPDTTYDQKWDLDVIFEGGSESDAFHQYLQEAQEKLQNLSHLVNEYTIPTEVSQAKDLRKVIDHVEGVELRLRESFAFVGCLSAQDVTDKKALQHRAKISEMAAGFSTVMTTLEQKLNKIDDSLWKELLAQPELKELSFVLNEKREKAKEKLSLEQESLINDLSVDGYQGWDSMYSTIVGKMKITMEENGETKELSVGQASNKMGSSDRSVRKEMFHKLQDAWEENEDLFGETLNHLAGFRVQTYKHRGWDNVLKEPMDINRMSEKTLNAMWNAINKYKDHFVEYLNRKATLLGLERLSWYDVGAPIVSSDQSVSYDEGAEFIVEQFEKFGPKMASFAKMAFENSWIEAEDRSGKRPGGFCTSFPDSKQTRIFMTYSGTASNVSTLAHELGHAFHQHVMDDVHSMNQGYAMNVAETASTFAEMIVADAAVKHASNEEERLSLLEDKIQRSVAFFMNIHSRFLFEKRFYEERKQGLVPVDRLNTIMVEAQKEAFLDSLDEYEPHFWASKLHFHKVGVPFYNFPYTFGYLFSQGIYAKALEEGSDVEENYIALLQDTGRMKVEDLAKKHLDIDLEQPDFWESAVKLCVKDVDEFLQMTAE